GAPARVDVNLETTTARLGWRPERIPLRAWATTEVGTMVGTGVALTSSQVGSGTWLATGVGFGVAWPMMRWARLVGTSEMLVAVQRAQFHLDDGVVVYVPSPLTARVTLGLEVGWP